MDEPVKAKGRHWGKVLVTACLVWIVLFSLACGAARWMPTSASAAGKSVAPTPMEVACEGALLLLTVGASLAFMGAMSEGEWPEPVLLTLFFSVVAGIVVWSFTSLEMGPSAALSVCKDLALLNGAFALAKLLANRVEKAWWILLLVMVGATADMWSVMAPSGLSRGLVETDSAVLQVVLVGCPQPGTGRILGFIGVADYIFFAFFYLVARKFGFRYRVTFWLLGVGIMGTLAAVAFLGLPLPVVPAMAAIFLAYHWRDCLWPPGEAGPSLRSGAGHGEVP